MSLNIKHMIILLVYAIGINLVLISFANMGIGINCSNIEDMDYNQTYNLTEDNNTDIKQSSASIVDLALGRCEGIPYWLFMIFELPIIVGLLYIIRGFIGAT